LRRALVPLRLLALLLGLGLTLLLGIWITTRRSLDLGYTNKIHGAGWIVPSCSVVLGPSLDVGVIIMTIRVVDERSWWVLSLLLLLLRVGLGLGVGGVCLLWVTGAIGLSLTCDILLSLSRVGNLMLRLRLRLRLRLLLLLRLGLDMRVRLRLGDSRLGSGRGRLSIWSGLLLLRYGHIPTYDDPGDLIITHLRRTQLGLRGIHVMIRHCRECLSLGLWLGLRVLLWINVGIRTRLSPPR